MGHNNRMRTFVSRRTSRGHIRSRPRQPTLRTFLHRPRLHSRTRANRHHIRPQLHNINPIHRHNTRRRTTSHTSHRPRHRQTVVRLDRLTTVIHNTYTNPLPPTMRLRHNMSRLRRRIQVRLSLRGRPTVGRRRRRPSQPTPKILFSHRPGNGRTRSNDGRFGPKRNNSCRKGSRERQVMPELSNGNSPSTFERARAL